MSHSRIEHEHELTFQVAFTIEPERFPADRDPEQIAAEIKSRIESVMAPWVANPIMIEVSGRCCIDEAIADGETQIAEFGRRLVEQLRPQMRRNPLPVVAAVAEIANTDVPPSTSNPYEFAEWVVSIFAKHGIDFDGDVIVDMVSDFEMNFPGADDEPEPAAVDWDGDDVGRVLDLDARRLLQLFHDARDDVRSHNGHFPDVVAELARQWKITTDNWDGIDDDRVDPTAEMLRRWFAAFVREDFNQLPDVDEPLVERRIL